MDKQGKYVVIEGHDGTGKSTQVERIGEILKVEHDIDSVQFHEPAGAPIANELRQIIKNGNLERDPITNLLLFTAARRETWEQIGRKAISEGVWVLGARNWYSTVAYQGYGEGLSVELIESVTRQFTLPEYIEPDLSVLLTLEDEAIRQQRVEGRGPLDKPDTFESREAEFQTNVYEGYLQIARDEGLTTIDASPELEVVTGAIMRLIQDKLLDSST